MTDELDDFEEFDCQTVGRQVSPWEMLRLLRTINLLVAERNTKKALTGEDIPEVETTTTAYVDDTSLHNSEGI